MIELEIQGLSGNREGLLIEVGRLVVVHEFTLQRQRLVHDPHGILLTLVVRGPSRRKRALETALEGCDRFVSVKVFPFVEGERPPHFAASSERTQAADVIPSAPITAAPAPAPADAPAMASEHVVSEAVVPAAMAAIFEPVEPAPGPESEFDFILPTPPPPPPAPARIVDRPAFVDLTPLEPDETAVDQMLHGLESAYPQIVPALLELRRSVAAGARESSLALAGRRVGAWVFEHDYALDDGLDLPEAIERLGAPALRALVEVDQQGAQLHIQGSPLCAEDGHSGCSFFSGFLEGLLGPAIASRGLSIFPVCCRSYGADECVLAISD